jgi:tetratricopeptide (TPR) repeat protein
MSKEHDKLMAEIQRLIAGQEFNSEEELQTYLKGILGQEIPSSPHSLLSAEEQAQDLVFAAYKLPINKAKLKIEKALQLDRNCIVAYEFLGTQEDAAEIAIVFYEKGIQIGKQRFGGAYLKENKGFFWGLHETRPYMRCLQHYSDCLYAMGEVKECVRILEEMIELNPNDNQGVRDLLLLYLIELDERKKFKKYAEMYKEDDMAFSLFNHALFAYATMGETAESNKKLQLAMNQNKFVVPNLLSRKEIKSIPEYHGFGDENEAIIYVHNAQFTWQTKIGAIEWIKRHSGN